MLVAGAGLAVTGMVGASAAPAGSPGTVASPAATGASDNMTRVGDRRRHHGGNRYYNRHHGGRGYSNFWYGAPLIAAPFLYNGYDDYGYNGYSYRYGGRNSCYRACRYEHGPRYCSYHWENYC